MALDENKDVASVLGAFLISAISAAISIAQRMLRGYPTSALWLFSESLSAILAGYLAWDLYPLIKDSLPTWASQPLLIAASAHYGGRLFQTVEKHFSRTTGIEISPDQKPKPPRKPRASKTKPKE